MSIVISSFNFNSKHYEKCKFALIYFTGNKFQFIPIEKCTKMPTLPTLCILENSTAVRRAVCTKLKIYGAFSTEQQGVQNGKYISFS